MKRFLQHGNKVELCLCSQCDIIPDQPNKQNCSDLLCDSFTVLIDLMCTELLNSGWFISPPSPDSTVGHRGAEFKRNCVFFSCPNASVLQHDQVWGGRLLVDLTASGL